MLRSCESKLSQSSSEYSARPLDPKYRHHRHTDQILGKHLFAIDMSWGDNMGVILTC